MLHKVMEEQNYERNRNEEVKNDVEKEKDYEDDKKVLTLHIEKTRNGVMQKVCVKLLK